ncbi:MAG TPA: A24 family peptidase, partial [Acidimicrobiia bacterium]|nr:A24 family peptidase [Acidimicrobiia bacterium]
GMGMGDVKLAFSLGLYLGWLGWGQVFLGGFLAFLLGAVVGVALIAMKIKSRKDFVPFGPFLALGTMLTILWGDPILRWYTGT